MDDSDKKTESLMTIHNGSEDTWVIGEQFMSWKVTRIEKVITALHSVGSGKQYWLVYGVKS